jgi:hypothetical protein
MAIKHVFAALAALLPPSFVLAQTATTGSLRGSVVDAQGAPLAGAQVRYRSFAPSVAAGLRATPAPGETITNGLVSSNSDGSFMVTGLPPATYTLCARVPAAAYLDSCVWGFGAGVTVSAGATAAQTITLQQGVYLNVRINDPLHLLPQVIDGPWTARKLGVGVWYGNGAYRGVSNTSVDSAGRNYQLTIPASTPFSLWLYSTDIVLADPSGNVVTVAQAGAAPAASVSFQASPGVDQSFTFTVSGRANSAP